MPPTNGPDEITKDLDYIKSGISRNGEGLKSLKLRTDDFESCVDGLQRTASQLRKRALNVGPQFSHPSRSMVSERLARFAGAVTILGANNMGRLDHLGEDKRSSIVDLCRASLATFSDASQRAALTSADIPLPTEFSAELIALVETYGTGRKYGTLYSVGGKTKLPRLGSSPRFGFIDMSAAIDEKKPTLEFVDFDPEKAGGIIRIPSEIDADSIVELGEFIVTYCVREMARWQDTVFFTADGTATYKLMKGCGKAAVDLGKKIVLGAGKTAPSDIALADLRAMRGKVCSAALKNAAYYLHHTCETLLVKFNTPENVTTLAHSKGQPVRFADPVYVARGKSGGPELDGYPVRFIPVLPAYSEDPAASQIQAVFGDATFQYIATRQDFTLQLSRDVYFATDEIAVRALERFAVGLMDDSALSALQLAPA
jgi:HK97 family phage major capsid protein